MKGAIAIAKKELRTYFYSPIAYVVLGLFVVAMGWIFAVFVNHYMSYNMAQRYGQAAQGITLDTLAKYFYQNASFFLMALSPFISMRLFAEEKRQHTIELLFTAPISDSELVLGKFLGGVGLMMALLGTTLIYTLFMVVWGNPELSVIFTTYLGLVLGIGFYISVGALMSTFTESQAIAAVFTFFILFLLWLLQSIGSQIDVKFGFFDVGATLAYLSPLSHMTNFTDGLLHVKDIVYFLSGTFFMLFLTHRVVESHRWR